MKDITRIKYLDTIRGIAAFNIVLAHVLVTFPMIGINGSGTGKISVCMFFVLSGFLLAMPYCTGKDFKGRDIYKFYVKKFIRIYPCFVIALFLGVLLGLIEPEKIWGILSFSSVYGHLWYIPVELGFYAVAPIGIFILSHIKSNWVKAGILFGIAVVLEILFPYVRCEENSIIFSYYLPVFIMGMILAVLIFDKKDDETENMIYDVLCILVAAGFIIAIPGVRYWMFGIPSDGYLQNKYLFMGGAWTVFLLALHRSKCLKKILERDMVFSKIGSISYPLYLCHYLILQFLCIHTENNVIRFVGTFGISLGVAWILHKVIEEPLGKLMSKW